MFVIPYILPMLLGRTYDYNSAHVGVDIFAPTQLNAHKVTINRYFTQSRFRLIRSTRDVDDLLDIKGELSLKVMADVVNVEGMGSYLRDKQDRETTVEILCRVKYETVTETLDTSAQPKSNWQNFNARSLGSHYVRSVTYGGELIASLKFKTKSKKDAKKIQAAVSAGIGIEGTLDLAVGGKFEKIKESLDSSVSVDIKYYATVPVRGVAQNLEGLQKLISGFSDHVKAVGGGKGNPIRVEIFPLSSLKQGTHFVNFIRSAAVSAKLQEVVEKYDDVLTAARELTSWVSRLDQFSSDIERQIGTFNNELSKVSDAFYKVVVSLEIDSQAKSDQFSPALAAYKGTDPFVLPGKFMRAFRVLKREVDQKLTGVGACVFGPPIVNAGVLRDNVLNTGKSKAIAGSTNLKTCKQRCVQDSRCLSITYYLKSGNTGVDLNSQDKCYINYVSLSSTRLVPVPHRGNNDVMIFVRNRSGKC